jgi:hypothetical protein
MTTTAATLPNSLKSLVDQLSKDFKIVTKTVQNFETHQARSVDMLYQALADVYKFGEDIVNLPTQDGKSIISEFFGKQKVAYNARVRANPYIGLLKLAFMGSGSSSSESSRSQYATVLEFAVKSKISPSDFKAWLSGRGIEYWRDEAVKAKNSKGHQNLARRRAQMLENARTTLAARPASLPVSLPAGVEAPEGYAIFIARVDGSNKVEIIDVLETDEEKVNNQIVALVKEAETPTTPIDPLACFLRAVGLIVKLTPDKIDSRGRDILIWNAVERGSPVAFAEAVCEAHSFPGARIKLACHVGSLPLDHSFILKGHDAAVITAAKHANFEISDTGLITSADLTRPISLTYLNDAGSYRTSPAVPTLAKSFTTTSEQMNEVSAYIKRERDTHARKNANRADNLPFPSNAMLSWGAGRLLVQVPHSLLTSTLAQVGTEMDLNDCALTSSEIERVAETLAAYNLALDGWLMDADVDNAAIVLNATLDDDELSIVLPTKVGANYNQVSSALVLA